MSAPFAELSNEEAILNFIFDPHKSFIGFDAKAAHSVVSTATNGTTNTAKDNNNNESSVNDEDFFLQNREREAIRLADQDNNYTQALQILDEIIKQYSDRPSAYNNRAQVKRLQGSDDNVLEDLNTAISIASSKLWNLPMNSGNNTDTLSSSSSFSSSTIQASTSASSSALSTYETTYYKNVLKQAHTQRAVYYHNHGKEDLANQDLDAAASYGSKIAQMMTTGTNPYATLCHHTVQMMLDTEQGKLDTTQ